MIAMQEAKSWAFPTNLPTSPVPRIGQAAPPTEGLGIPSSEGRPAIVTFLRHCGCPFAEKTFLYLRATAASNPTIRCIAISHSSSSATDKWLEALGGRQSVEVIIDENRELFAQWGLGISSFWHVLSPWGLWDVYKLGKGEGIWNRPTESGTRWQTAGSFACDGEGIVRWGGAAGSASDVPDFGETVKALEADK
ncbi:hypothetical protein K402DRAFT_468028 [Aulographum hederae CBS 113979]|uniref:Thioredoxin domain-containing protein n=1 Tax=Aulographum hederae CBS 113979 TaxID=1176131 RepID=A0A6G1GIJ6_9PEZI|nr:hypothetical protein K402DRAFT_468028 [Aulographum hederae CBS 113979]